MKRGWCPSLFEHMTSGDGLLARVKPPLGRMSAEAARQVAAAARACGNGQLELTNRGALQVRGLAEATLAPFREAVLAAGLASADPAVERRRNVLVSPFVDAAGEALAAELERWIAQDRALASLPGKFGFAVGCTGADITLTSLPIEAAGFTRLRRTPPLSPALRRELRGGGSGAPRCSPAQRGSWRRRRLRGRSGPRAELWECRSPPGGELGVRVGAPRPRPAQKKAAPEGAAVIGRKRPGWAYTI